ncbi:MAG TPA: TolC family protein, partial [Pirellulaceae bacterium]|nr:TolC family protein [Pirellulaceae bacterium]
MSRPFRTAWVLVMIAITVCTGCHPSQPFYLHEDGDLDHYINAATEIEEPDLVTERLAEVENAQAPLTISNSDKFEIWDLALEDCISIALQNSKVLKSIGAQSNAATQIFQPDILRGVGSGQTIYDPSILETDPQAGVETALSDFDAQFTTQAFWQKTDRPQNINQAQFPFVPLVLRQNLGQVDAGVTKKTGTGVQSSLRSQTIFDDNNRGSGRPLPSDFFQAVEAEAKVPLARGRGTQINRLPIVLARLRVDVSLADFEAAVRNHVFDTEKAYWELNAVYRALETAKLGRDSALGSWRNTRLKQEIGTESTQQESQAREQYFFFRAQVETQLQNVYNTENTLRFLMGLAATDGRLIRPSDDPSTALVEFDWNEIHAEALTRSVELRRQKWTIKQRELQLIAARNQLLPQFNVTLLYRWLGL